MTLEPSNATPKQTAFIVDDDHSVCESLCDLIDSAGMSTQHYPSAEAFLDAWTPDMAGCLVLDVRLPGMSGIKLQGILAEAGLSIPIIIMTAHGDVPMVRKAMKAGAVEFLTKPFQDDELLQAIEQAFSRDRDLRAAKTLENSILGRLGTLTPRERQVMKLVTTGMTNKEIADTLDLKLVTVKLYRGQVMEKMQAHSLADLVKMSERIKMP
jgi:FixJ family two-component response regulator